LKHGVAEKFEQLQLRFELNFIREAEGVVVREWAAIQQVKDHLNGPLRLCLLQSELIVPEIGQWRLDTFVHSLKALIEFLKSMTDMALARVDKISRAELALLGATPEERKQVLNAVHQLAESSTESFFNRLSAWQVTY
jgi:hypothetical protein